MTAASAWALGIVFLGLCTMACATAPAPSAQSSPSAGIQELYSRPLRLPVLVPGATCPESPAQTIGSGPLTKQNDIPSPGQGMWPVFLSGSLNNGWFAGQGALLLISPEYVGPLIVRGRQLDGSGGMPLAASSGSIEIGATTSTSWRQVVGQIRSGISPGCYGLQADGFNFTSLIVIAVVPGSLPPG